MCDRYCRLTLYGSSGQPSVEGGQVQRKGMGSASGTNLQNHLR